MVDIVRFAAPQAVSAPRIRLVNHAVTAPKPSLARSNSETLSLATALAQQGPPVESAKVAQLRAAVDGGTYVVDVATLADAMMRFGGGPRV